MRTIVVGSNEPFDDDLVTALAEFPEIEVVRQVAPYPEPEDFLRIIRARRRDFVIHLGRRFHAVPSLGGGRG